MSSSDKEFYEDMYREQRMDTIGQNGNDGDHYDKIRPVTNEELEASLSGLCAPSDYLVSTKVKSDGWSTSYYELPEWATELQDLIEHKNMNFAVANIFKAAYRLGSKEGHDELYDLNKIIWFAEREKKRIQNEK